MPVLPDKLLELSVSAEIWAFRYLCRLTLAEQRAWKHPITKVAFEEQLQGTQLWSGPYCPKSRKLQVNAMPGKLPGQLSTSLPRFPLCGQVTAWAISSQEWQSKWCVPRRQQIRESWFSEWTSLERSLPDINGCYRWLSDRPTAGKPRADQGQPTWLQAQQQCTVSFTRTRRLSKVPFNLRILHLSHNANLEEHG